MRTAADIKRRCQLGTKLMLIYHIDPAVQVPIDREVIQVQSNAIAMSPWPGRSAPSWLYWGKASELRVEDENTFSVLDPDSGDVEITYRFVTDAS